MEDIISVVGNDTLYLVEGCDFAQQPMHEAALIAYLERKSVPHVLIEELLTYLPQIGALTLSKEAIHHEWVLLLPLPSNSPYTTR